MDWNAFGVKGFLGVTLFMAGIDRIPCSEAVVDAGKTILTDSLKIPPDLAQVASARQFVANVAIGAGFPEERVFDITVACSEAMANAIEHSPVKAEVTVTTLLHPDRLEVQIQGAGEFRAPNCLKERKSRGLGLPLMAKLSDHMALFSGPTGDTFVSLTFYRPGVKPQKQGAVAPSFAQAPIVEGINRIYAAALSSKTEEELGEICLEVAEGLTQSDFGFIGELGLNGRLYDITISNPGWDACRIADAQGHRRPVGDFAIHGIYGRVLRDGRSLFTNDPANHPDSIGLPPGHPPLAAFLGTPLLRRGAVTGMVAVGNRKGGYSDDQRNLLEALAPIIAEAFDRKRAEEALRDAERKNRELVRLAPAGIYEIDFRQRRLTSVNEAMTRITGYSEDELLGMDAMQLLATDEDRAHFGRRIERWLRGEQPESNVEFRVRTKHGGLIWAVLDVSFTVDEEGRPLGAAVVAYDVTERRQVEEALRQSEEKYRALIETNADFVWEMDAQGRYTYCSPQMEAVWGLKPEDMLGRTPFDVMPAEDRERAARAFARTGLSATALLGFETNAYDKDGRLRLVETNAIPIVDMDGRVTGYRGTSRDITERKRAEDALQESEERYRTLFDSIDQGFCVIEVLFDEADRPVDYRFLEVNAAFERQTGIRNAVGRRMREIAPDHEERWFQTFGRIALTGRPQRFENPARALDRYYDVYAFRVGVPDERRVGVLFNDIRARKKAEETLEKSEERYRALAEENERLYRQQLDIAESLQLALLNIPSEMGPVRIGHLYRSATQAAQVGGDFYDAFEVKGNNVAMLVGDVAGHGIEAARTATLVKDVTHAFIHQSLRPHQVLRRTNALLVEKDLPGFVSLFLAILDTETGLLRYASAGHPETLLKRCSGEIQVLGSGSPPLGVFSDAKWKTSELCLDTGDLLLLYTDGVLETRRDDQFFGQQRLERLLRRKRISVQRLPHLILDQLLAFSHGTLTDDVAVLAVSFAGKTGERAAAPVQQSLLG